MVLEAFASVALCNRAARSSEKHLLVGCRRPSTAKSVTALVGLAAISTVLALKKKSRHPRSRNCTNGPNYLPAAPINAATASYKTTGC